MDKAKCATLFKSFFSIGAFTFGGGYAMIPLIQREVVERRKWLDNDDILEVVAIAESTPGPIAINAATFVGYRVAGFWGSFFATLGVVLPSFCVILAIAYLLRGFQDYRAVRYAFFGIRAGVLALLVKAVITMFRSVRKKQIKTRADAWVGYGVMILAFASVAVLKFPVLPTLLCCALIGLVQSLRAGKT